MKLNILCSEGHKEIDFDQTNTVSLAEVQEKFDKLRKKGHVGFDDNGRIENLSKAVGDVTVIPQVVGG